MHIELLTSTATAPSTGAAGAAVSGDSLTVKNGRGRIELAALWSKNQTAGSHQLVFGSGHDTTRNIRLEAVAGLALSLLPLGIGVRVQAQEVLAHTVVGSATAGDVEQLSALVAYDDLPGVAQRLMSASQVESRMERLTTLEATLASSAGPNYSGEELITAESDLLLPNRDYAVLGCISRTSLHAVYLRGPDLGNVKVGMPLDSSKPELCSQFFLALSRAHNRPLVPIINGSNKAATYQGVHTDENAGSFVVSWVLALLK